MSEKVGEVLFSARDPFSIRVRFLDIPSDFQILSLAGVCYADVNWLGLGGAGWVHPQSLVIAIILRQGRIREVASDK
jgi:hypothetical protein